MARFFFVTLLVASAFLLGWILASTMQGAPPVPQTLGQCPSVAYQHDSGISAVAPQTTTPSEREMVQRTPVQCMDCEKYREQIARLTSEREELQSERSLLQDRVATLQRQLDVQPLIGQLMHTLPDWQPAELESVLTRSRLFPMATDLQLAESFVRNGQLSPSALLDLAKEAGSITSERGKAMLYSGDEKTAQLAQVETSARAFIAKLNQEGFSLWAENFRTALDLK